MLFNTQDIPKALEPITVIGTEYLDIHRVALDSRASNIGRTDAFFCLVTKTGNGHRYIGKAYEQGVRCFVVSEHRPDYESLYPSSCFVVVEDTLRSLQHLALAHRESSNARVVAITGSNGKTIVKEMLYTLLYREVPGLYRSPGSYNSQIGVALALLAMPREASWAFIEAGISDEGEMQYLERMIQPEAVIVTHLGSAHRENFVDLPTLYREKLRLAEHSTRLITYHKPTSHYGAIAEEVVEDFVSRHPQIHYINTYTAIEDKASPTAIPRMLMDRASEENLTLALGAIRELMPQHYTEALAYVGELSPLPMRLELKENAYGNLLINDSYSNDLDALDLALSTQQGYGGKALVLGRIEQSGYSEEALLDLLKERFASYHLERIYLLGWDIKPEFSTLGRIDLRAVPSIESLLSLYSEDLLREKALLIKGARHQRLEELVRRLSMREHTTSLEVDLAVLRRNLSFYRSRLPEEAALICMIKADAYGLGAIEVARTLEETRQVQYLAVAVADEGKALRNKGVESPIIVMNPQATSLDSLRAYRLDAEVYSLEMLRLFADRFDPRERPALHLKVDSGMHRLGFRLEDIPAIVSIVDVAGVRLSSVFSHLAGADEERLDPFTHEQAEYLLTFYTRLMATLEQVASYRKPYPRLHLLNTAGLERFYKDYAFAGGRLGIGLYGFSPTGRKEVEPVARLTTTILQVKTIPEGDSVGYGCKAVMAQDTRVGIIPIGYADGLSRRYGNGRWSVEYDERLCPIIGNICMDACMIDLSNAPEAKEGDRVTIFGGKMTPIERMAEQGETIPYEVLTSISPRVARIYINA